MSTGIENFTKIDNLGTGAQGSVALYLDNRLGRNVAIKSLHPHLLKNSDFKDRFENEAKALAQLNHPGIVTLYDYIEGDSFHLIMEYVNGHPLDGYIKNQSGPIHELRAINIFIKILEAISFMHSRNIIHRDIKPSNIMLMHDDSIKLLDFGIAKDEASDKTLTRVGNTVGGSPVYMSPEHVKGSRIDESSDIYCLGVTLWQMISGKIPYSHMTSEYEIQNAIVNDKLPDVRDEYKYASKEISDIIKKAVSSDKSKRFNDCNSFIRTLEDLRLKLLNPKNDSSNEIASNNKKITIKVTNCNNSSIIINKTGFIGSELSQDVNAGEKVSVLVTAKNHKPFKSEFICNNDRIIEVELERQYSYLTFTILLAFVVFVTYVVTIALIN